MTPIQLLPAFSAIAAEADNVLGKRLLDARKKARLTQKDVVDQLSRCDVHIAFTAIHRWETGKSVPNAYQLMALCHVLHITDSIQALSGAPEIVTDPLNRQGRQMVSEYEAFLISTGRYAPSHETAAPRTLPVRVHDMPASAGWGEYLEEESYHEVEMPCALIPDVPFDFAVVVSGDSMEPPFALGQYAFVSLCDHLVPGELGLFVYDGEGLIKEYAQDRPRPDEMDDWTDTDGVIHPVPVLISHHPAYPPRRVRAGLPFAIVGRIVR